MALITWSSGLRIGIEEIDQQHKTLIDLINSLNDAMKSGKGNMVLEKIISDLLSYTKQHFQTEEDYLTKYGYSRKFQHSKEHQKFVDQVTNFNNDFQNKKIGLSIEVMNFLSNWLKEHILGTDMEYSQFLKEKGVS